MIQSICDEKKSVFLQNQTFTTENDSNLHMETTLIELSAGKYGEIFFKMSLTAVTINLVL